VTVRNGRPVVAIVAAVVLAATVGLVVAVWNWSSGLPLQLPLLGRACTVRADGQVTLDAEQMANAATITAVGIRRTMPERGIVVALATAYQESGLKNLRAGDRDSVGLFQQRPSQGWGTAEELRDPRTAAGKFYTSLKKVKGWRTMRVTDAAQKVQRSAYPEAYEKWADEAAVLARALNGKATGAVACTFTGEPVRRGAAALGALSRQLRLDWGLDLAPGADALGVDVRDARAGWRYAHWLVSHASENGVERVRYADLEWHAPTGRWKPVTGEPATARVVATVFGDAR
jgi:hypothetical protein